MKGDWIWIAVCALFGTTYIVVVLWSLISFINWVVQQ